METHLVSTHFRGGMTFDSTINDHHLVMDSGTANGGTNNGPSPKRLMLASLAGCTGIDIVSILNKMKVTFNDFSIEIQGSLSEDHPRIYNYVKISYKIKLDRDKRNNMEKAVKLSEDKYCGVMAMFKKFAQVDTEVIYL